MGKATKSIEQELLTATGEETRGDDEGKKKYIGRLVRAANSLEEGKWNKLSDEAQSWVNGNVEALNDKKPVTDFPAAEEPEDDDEDEAPPAPRKQAKAAAKDEDDEDDDEPAAAKKKAAAKDDDDEDDDEPAAAPAKKERAKVKADEDDDDDKPVPAKTERKARDPDAKKGAIPRLKELVVKHPSWKKAKLVEQLEKEGFSISANTVGIAYYDVRNTLRICKAQGVLTTEYAEKVVESDNTPEALKKGKADAAAKRAKVKDEDADEEDE